MRATACAIAAAALAAALPFAATAASKGGMHAAPASGGKTVAVHAISASGIGRTIGTITLRDTPQGLLISPRLSGLTPGQHGIHVHEKPNCGPGTANGQQAAGIAAGGHLDPAHSSKHLGPYDNAGHAGDLPALTVDGKGHASQPLVAPRLKLAYVVGHAIVIHAGGDNYRDQPQPLGGGGARVACGVIER